MVTSQLNSANAASILRNPVGVGSAGVAGDQTTERRPVYRALVLDAQGKISSTVTTIFVLIVVHFFYSGREIDEYGNVVKSGAAQVKTLAANVAVERAIKKKENPYLAHRSAPPPFTTVDGQPVSVVSAPGGTLAEPVVNVQLKRELRAKKALHFIEAGTLVEEAEKIKAKEERKIIAGYASGRKNIQHQKVGGDKNIRFVISMIDMYRIIYTTGARTGR